MFTPPPLCPEQTIASREPASDHRDHGHAIGVEPRENLLQRYPSLLVPIFAVLLCLVMVIHHVYRVGAGPTWKSTRTGRVTTYTKDELPKMAIIGLLVGAGLGAFCWLKDFGGRRATRPFARQPSGRLGRREDMGNWPPLERSACHAAETGITTGSPASTCSGAESGDAALREELLTWQPVEDWIEQLKNGDVADRCAAALALGELGPEKQEIMNALVHGLLDPDKAVHVAIGIAIGITKISPEGRKNLLHDLRQGNARVRDGAVKLLRWTGGGDG